LPWGFQCVHYDWHLLAHPDAVVAMGAAAQLHVSYTDTRLAFATAFLKARPNTRLVTIGLGANDAFLLQDSCASAVNPPLCVELGVATLLPQISANIDTILKAIRAQFHGLLVVVNYCSLDYADAAGTGFTRLLNQAETAPAHADVLSSQMLSVRSRPLRRPPLPVATRARPGCSTPSRRTSSCAMCTPASRDRSFWHRQWSRWSKPTRRDPAGGSRGHARLVSRREARNALQERHNADPPGATLATD